MRTGIRGDDAAKGLLPAHRDQLTRVRRLT
jgi:hypothetical protein